MNKKKEKKREKGTKRNRRLESLCMGDGLLISMNDSMYFYRQDL